MTPLTTRTRVQILQGDHKRCLQWKELHLCSYNGTTSGCLASGLRRCLGAYGSCKHNGDHKNRRCRNYQYPPTLPTAVGCAQQQLSAVHHLRLLSACGLRWILGCYGSCSYDNKDHENEHRVYTVTQGPKHNGFACPHANNLRHCTKSGCGQPVDCEGEWSAYGVCFHDPSSKKNQKCRKYKYTTNAASNGKSCPHSEGKSECVTSGCPQPVNCVGSWGSWILLP